MHNSFIGWFKKIHTDTRGMTFLELMVVIAIFGMIAGVVLFNFKDFTGGISLQNTAQEIALRITQAQRYAISGNVARSTLSTTGNEVRPTFGVYFDSLDGSHSGVSFDSAITPDKQFILFADIPPTDDGVFERNTCGQAASTECLELVKINTGDFISDICANEKSNGGVNATCDIDMPVNITFSRPFPDAHFDETYSGGIPVAVDDLEIKIQSIRGQSKTIIIWKTGQISVESAN